MFLEVFGGLIEVYRGKTQANTGSTGVYVNFPKRVPQARIGWLTS